MFRSLPILSLLCCVALVSCERVAADAEPATYDLTITGMTCEGCVSAIEGTLAATDGIRSCTVELESETAQVVTDPGISEESVIQAIGKIGGGQYSASHRGT